MIWVRKMVAGTRRAVVRLWCERNPRMMRRVKDGSSFSPEQVEETTHHLRSGRLPSRTGLGCNAWYCLGHVGLEVSIRHPRGDVKVKDFWVWNSRERPRLEIKKLRCYWQIDDVSSHEPGRGHQRSEYDRKDKRTAFCSHSSIKNYWREEDEPVR